MAKPVRLRRQRGQKVKSPNGLPIKCVDPTSRWGNPFVIGKDGLRREVIAKHREWFLWGSETKNVGRFKVCPVLLRGLVRQELGGYNLACPCRIELPCHADTLLEVANSPKGEWPRKKG